MVIDGLDIHTQGLQIVTKSRPVATGEHCYCSGKHEASYTMRLVGSKPLNRGAEMEKNRNREMMAQAIKNYISEKDLFTEYETVTGLGDDWSYYGVFDMPDDYDPKLGLMQDGPEYRPKPVLIARIGRDGYAYVEETEYTDKYMNRRAKATA